MNVRCHMKYENERRSLYYYCWSSSHQKSVSADDESKLNKPSQSSPQNQTLDSGSVHESQRQQLFWLSLHCSHRRRCCVLFSLECFTCAAPPANHLVPSLQNPYKSRVSLVESENFPAREVCDWSVLTKIPLRMGRVPSMTQIPYIRMFFKMIIILFTRSA